MEWKWEVIISMDFIIEVPKMMWKYDSIVVVIYNLTKVAYFILIDIINIALYIVEVFTKDIVSLQGVP